MIEDRPQFFTRKRRVTMMLAALLALVVGETALLILAQRRTAALSAEVQKLRMVLGYSGMMLGLPAREIGELKKKGLSDPPADIIADLVENRGYVLPREYAGREIGVRFKSNVQFLSPRWVLAGIENEGMNGKVLLEFGVAPGGRITWRIIDSYLERTGDAAHRL